MIVLTRTDCKQAHAAVDAVMASDNPVLDPDQARMLDRTIQEYEIWVMEQANTVRYIDVSQ